MVEKATITHLNKEVHFVDIIQIAKKKEQAWLIS